ncbi:MAG: hypothetical protein V1689_00040 [Pseudomonadota bacterium]
MRNWIACISFFFVLGLYSFPNRVLAGNFVETAGKGKIDWSNRIIEAVGVGGPPKNPINLAQARAMAKKAAITAAQQNLLETVRNMRIDSKTLVKDFVSQGDPVHREFEGFIQYPNIVDISYLSSGEVQVTVAVKLTGPFADMLLPKAIRDIQPVKQPKIPDKGKGTAYTGLVLDCRGLKVMPAIAPRILDEDGNEVYGAKYVNRGYAVEQGMAGYTTDLEGPPRNLRVGKSPITVKAIRAAKSGPSDIVISISDADLIRRDPRNLRFLQECRVMIVLN